MINSFFQKNVNQKSLKEVIKFSSKLNKKTKSKLTIFSKFQKDVFLKQNFNYFLLKIEKKEYQEYIEVANLVLKQCTKYSWNNIWINFKKIIYEKEFTDYHQCNIFFKWVLLLIYLNDQQSINLDYFFLIHEKFKQEFITIGLIRSYNSVKTIEFNKEISQDIDKIDYLLLKVKDFFNQLEDFFIQNISFLANEFNFSYNKIQKKLIKNQYFFKQEFIGELITPNIKEYKNDFTTINGNLNLPIPYIFIKYLVDNNFLLINKDLINKFLKKISTTLKIQNISLLESDIFDFLSFYYLEYDNGYYIFGLSKNIHGNTLIENDIIEEFKIMIDKLKYFLL